MPARVAQAALVALLLFARPAASAAVPELAAVFRRSCSECSSEEFCEFAYEGAPADHVACVANTVRANLYRRYDAQPRSYTNCGAGNACCLYAANSMVRHAGVTTDANCRAACEARSGCTHYTFRNTPDDAGTQCYTAIGCLTYENDNPGFSFYAAQGSACPTQVC